MVEGGSVVAEKYNEISIEKSRDGHSIFTLNGMHLCSSFYPQKEAEKWAQGVVDKRYFDIASLDRILVLGLGCGYRVVELSKKTKKKILVFEQNQEIINFFHQTFPIESKEIEIVDLSYLGSLEPIQGKLNNKIKNEVNSLLATYCKNNVIFCCFLEPSRKEKYSVLYKFICGRGVEDLKEQVQIRSEQKELLEKVGFFEKNEASKKLLSINDFNKVVEDNGIEKLYGVENTFAKWKILTELVK